MTVWVLFLILPLIVAAWIVRPLLVGAGQPETDAESQRRAVLADQLAEIARDRDAGIIDADTEAAMATEVKRRLLAGMAKVEPVAEPTQPRTSLQAGRRLAAVIALVLVAGSVGAYSRLGLPGAPDVPLSARLPAETAPAAAIAALPEAERLAAIRTMVEGLEARLTAEPDDIAGWVRLGRAWRVLGENDRSDRAYDQAVAHLPEDAKVPDLIRLAHAMHPNEAVGQGLTPPPAHEAVMRRILAVEPTQPEALWFIAQAEDRAGNRQNAAEHLKALLVQMPEDAPARAVVEREIARLAAGG